MTLVEFIKSQLSKDTEIGDLAKDIQGDLEFPSGKSEEEIISYLNFKTLFGGINDTFKKLLQEYKRQTQSDSNALDIDAKFGLLRAENWKLYKEHFPVDKVILVGKRTDIYKVYCIDSSNQKALYFDIKSSYNLNDIAIKDVEQIHFGNLTEEATVSEAIVILENCLYDTPVKPNAKNLNELIEFLKFQVSETKVE